MTSPGGADPVERWHGDGWCLLEGVFTPEEVESARVAVAGLFPPASAVAAGEVREEDIAWGARKPTFPFADEALNRLVVHDAVIDLAEELLGTDQLRLYQGMVSAKYPGLRDEYEQLLHVDYANHTLVVPRDDVGFQHLELFVYLSDVSPETAATRMVPRRLTGGIPVERTYGTIGAGLQTLVGGNITLLTNLCEKTRAEAFDLMLQHAAEIGGNAVVGARYDATEVMQGVTEVLAYGTAVFVETAPRA